MVSKIGKYKIPFCRDGRLRSDYSGYYRNRQNEFVLKDNYAFQDTMKFVRGDYMVSLSTGFQYRIFRGDMKDLLLNAVIDHGVVSGVWCFVKRGTVYGIAILTSDDAEKLAIGPTNEDDDSIVERLGIE